MHGLKLLLIFSVMLFAPPLRAADKTASDDSEAQKKETPSERAERPPLETMKLSPRVRQSAPRPDESGKMKRVAPPRAESPLLNVPALKDLPPSPGSEASDGR